MAVNDYLYPGKCAKCGHQIAEVAGALRCAKEEP